MNTLDIFKTRTKNQQLEIIKVNENDLRKLRRTLLAKEKEHLSGYEAQDDDDMQTDICSRGSQRVYLTATPEKKESKIKHYPKMNSNSRKLILGTFNSISQSSQNALLTHDSQSNYNNLIRNELIKGGHSLLLHKHHSPQTDKSLQTTPCCFCLNTTHSGLQCNQHFCFYCLEVGHLTCDSINLKNKKSREMIKYCLYLFQKQLLDNPQHLICLLCHQEGHVNCHQPSEKDIVYKEQ